MNSILCILSLVTLLQIISSAVPEESKPARLFINFFKSKEIIFNSMVALLNLPQEERLNICQEFMDQQKGIRAADSLTVINLSLNQDQTSQVLKMPVFSCDEPNAPDYSPNYSYVSYIPEENGSRFFKLETNYSNNHAIREEIVDTKVKPTPKTNLQKWEKETLEYFKSEAYQKKATVYLTLYSSEGYWLTPCEVFDIEYSLPEGINNTSMVKLETIILENYDPVQLPLVPCPLDKKSTKIFYVGYATKDVALKVIRASDGKNRVDYDLQWLL